MYRGDSLVCWEKNCLWDVHMEMLDRQLEVRGSGELKILALSEGIYARNPGKKMFIYFCL